MSIRAALVDDMLTQLSITSLIDQRIFDDFFEFEDFLNQKANKNQFPAISVETSGDELEEKLTGHNQLDTASLIITCYIACDRGLKIRRLVIINNRQRPLKNVQFCSSSRKAKISTTGILRVFRGLKFEPDTEIGQKGTFFKGLSRFLLVYPH